MTEATSRRVLGRRSTPFLVLLMLVVAVAGCANVSTNPGITVATPLGSPMPVVAADVWAARGSIVEQTLVTDFFDDADHVIGTARRAVYRSVSGLDGGMREVSGVFFVPRGTPPPGGWPVVSLAHGTTGIEEDCGPSQDPTLMGFLPAVKGTLAAGFAVAMSDYEGLGTPGEHPYLESRTSAFNVIDAVRALRNVFSEVSPRWVTFGNSQGGQAAWAADEVAQWYGNGLDFAGSAALSPAANITPIADLAYTRSLSRDQSQIMPMLVTAVQRYDQSLRGYSLVSDVAGVDRSTRFNCRNGGADLTPASLAGGVRLDDEATVTILRNALRRIALPQSPLTAPLLVITGLDDQTVPPEWVTAAVNEACALGGNIEYFQVQGAGHGDLGGRAYATLFDWLKQRIASAPPSSSCGEPPAILS